MTVPPDRTEELEEIGKEIRRIELELKLENLNKSETKLESIPHLVETLEVSTVPPNIGLIRSSRRNRPEKTNKKVRRGVEPVGENKIIWKAKLEMKEMFVKGRLLRGAVPPTTAVTPMATPVSIRDGRANNF